MKKYAIIVAAGSGTRMGGSLPKQFMLLQGKSILGHSVDAFLYAYDDMQVILVLPTDYVDTGKMILAAHPAADRIQITGGGATRFHSVKNGLALVTEESVIFVHDAVRCLVTKELIERCYSKALESGSAIPVIASKDSVRILSDTGSEVLDRNKVMLVQTPQTFLSKILISAFNTDHKESFTDEATVVESTGIKVSLVDGDENNIKITRPVDLIIAEKIMGNKVS